MFQLQLSGVDDDTPDHEPAPRHDAPEKPLLLSRTQRSLLDDILDKITPSEADHAQTYAQKQRARLEAWVAKNAPAFVRRGAIRMVHESLATIAILLPFCVDEEPASRVKTKKSAGASKRGAR